MITISRTAFENDFKASATKEILIIRQRDIFIPPGCRACSQFNIKLPPSQYDFAIFKSPILILAELKSTSQKSISIENKIIKKHQSISLEKFSRYKNVVPGFIFNFRIWNNETYFIFIDDYMNFIEYKNRKSIPLSYCQDVGIEVENKIKTKNYKYNIEKLFNDINNKYLQE